MLEDRGRADAVPGAEGDLEYEPVTALIPYLRAIRLHWRLIAATALVAMVSCAVFLQFLSPDYEAQAQVLVTPLTPDDQSFVGLPVVRTAPGDPTRTVTTVAGVIESPEVAERAAQGLDDEVDAAQIEDAVTVAPEEGSNVIDITANADDPELAAAIASAYAEAALKVRQEILRPLVGAAIKRGETQLESIADQQGTAAEAIRTRVSELSALQDRSDPTLSVAQLATVPSSPLDKPAWLLLAVAAVAGALLGIGALALGRSLTERLIEDEDGLLRTLPLKIYARVPVGKRRADEDADRRGPPDRSAYHLLRVQLEAREIQLRGRDAPQIGPSGVVAIVGLSPGAATRNTALGLGSAIGQAGGEAIVLDGASHPLGGPVLPQFGSEPQPTTGTSSRRHVRPGPIRRSRVRGRRDRPWSRRRRPEPRGPGRARHRPGRLRARRRRAVSGSPTLSPSSPRPIMLFPSLTSAAPELRDDLPLLSGTQRLPLSIGSAIWSSSRGSRPRHATAPLRGSLPAWLRAFVPARLDVGFGGSVLFRIPRLVSVGCPAVVVVLSARTARPDHREPCRPDSAAGQELAQIPDPAQVRPAETDNDQHAVHLPRER